MLAKEDSQLAKEDSQVAREDSQSINPKYKEHLQTKFNKIQTWLKKNFQDLSSGKIYVQTISALDNYNGSILSGNSCGLTGRVDNRHGVIASHDNQVEIFSIQENSSIICTNYGTIWAKTALQIQAPKIIKDDTSYIEGLTVTNLRSFKGPLRYEGPTVGSDLIFTQDQGFYYQAQGVKAQSFTLATSITSNILEQPLLPDH